MIRSFVLMFCLSTLTLLTACVSSSTVSDQLIGEFNFPEDSPWRGRPLQVSRGDDGLQVHLEGHVMPLREEEGHWVFTTGDRITDPDSPAGFYLEEFIVGWDDATEQVYFSSPEMLPDRVFLIRE